MPIKKGKRYVEVRVPNFGAWPRHTKAFWIRFIMLGVATGLAMAIGWYWHEVASISFALIASKGMEVIGEALSESLAEDV